MRIRVLSLAGLYCLRAMADDAILSGPTMGLVYSSGTLRQVIGSPGAAYTGAALPLDFVPENVIIAPEQSFALATAEGKLVVIDASKGKVTLRPVDGATDLGSVWFSPAGKSALLLSKTGMHAQLLTGMPESPRVSAQLVLSEAAAIAAISEDARFALTAADSGMVSQWDGDGNLRGALALGDVASLQFYNRSGDALVASRSNRKLYKFREAGDAIAVADMDVTAAATSSDDSIVYAISADGAIQAMRENGESLGSFQSPIPAIRLQRMGGVLRLNDYGELPLAVFDGSQVLLIPPAKTGGDQ
jgi:hypothetical protein